MTTAAPDTMTPAVAAAYAVMVAAMAVVADHYTGAVRLTARELRAAKAARARAEAAYDLEVAAAA